MTTSDPASQSNYVSISSEHLELDWTLDVEKRLISGSVEHTIIAHHASLAELVLDTSYLVIQSVSINGSTAKYTLEDRINVVGSALRIQLPEMAKGDRAKVKVEYSTTAKCTATGWLEKEQTGSGKWPVCYTQCQAIHARSIVPCQDTPAVKATYTAKVKSSIPTFMSALRTKPDPSEVFTYTGQPQAFEFNQPVPIPSYLIALLAGDFVYRRTGKRTGVYAEPNAIDAVEWEFKEDIERFLDKFEELSGTYEFGQYDCVVLPASFPFGGMENSNLTFLTPTLVSGDRSNVDVVAHEIAHSAFGNLIGCYGWTHFWLNEGWTTYVERLIIKELYGEPARGLSYIQGAKALRDSLKGYANYPNFQKLVIPYTVGEDPDDGFSSIPYDKGASLLLHLERVLGGLYIFKPYILAYVRKFRHQSITTQQWKDHLYSYFLEHHGQSAVKKLDTVDWEAWFHGTGTQLPVKMEFDTTLADGAYRLAERWEAARKETGKLDFSSEDVKDFTSGQLVVFLERLLILSPEPLPAHLIESLNEIYSLDSSTNCEIKLRWYSLSLDSSLYAQEAAAWCAKQGRMKFCRPIYESLKKVDLQLARKTFVENEGFYHPIAREQIRKSLFGKQ